MCEIFPEVESCCWVASVRVGMLLIGVLSVTTGAISLGVIEQRTNVGLDKVLNMYSNASHITEPEQALSQLSDFIASTVSAMSVVFMLGGLLLLFSTLSDQEGFAQMFVWLIFVNIVVGLFMILAIAFECILQSQCLLGNMDWLSAATSLVMMVFYCLMWFYFICVANSYVVNGYT